MMLTSVQREVIAPLRCDNGCDPSFLTFVHNEFGQPIIKTAYEDGRTVYRTLLRCAECDAWLGRTMTFGQRKGLDEAVADGKNELRVMVDEFDRQRERRYEEFTLYLLGRDGGQ